MCRPSASPSNATIAQASVLGSPNATTTVGGINFSTDHSDLTTVGNWLNNPAGLDAGTAATAVNDTYMLFTGQISLDAGANLFTITHDDGLQLNIEGLLNPLVVDDARTAFSYRHAFYGYCTRRRRLQFHLVIWRVLRRAR